MATMINVDLMLARLKAELAEEMAKAAEPVILKAVEEAEKEIRKRLGLMFISLLDQSYSVERDGNYLRIIIQHDRM